MNFGFYYCSFHLIAGIAISLQVLFYTKIQERHRFVKEQTLIEFIK